MTERRPAKTDRVTFRCAPGGAELVRAWAAREDIPVSSAWRKVMRAGMEKLGLVAEVPVYAMRAEVYEAALLREDALGLAQKMPTVRALRDKIAKTEARMAPVSKHRLAHPSSSVCRNCGAARGVRSMEEFEALVCEPEEGA